jgi:uncharacterized membrane protein SpoIIM required for sporulation
MQLGQLRAERERYWLEFQRLLERVERHGLKALIYQQARRLGGLYRLTVSSYAVFRSLSVDRKLVYYLHVLITQAYLLLYQHQASRDVRVVRFYAHSWPALIKKHRSCFLMALLIMVLAVAASWRAALTDLQWVDTVVPDEVAQGRTSAASREELAHMLRAGRTTGAGERTFFAAWLFSNKTQVGFLAFALGVAGGIPSLLLCAYNGLILGAMVGLYHYHGLSVPFWAWVLPHGVTEILAVVLCVQAGMVVGLALIGPHADGRLSRLAVAGREAALIVLGTIPLFFLAALIEGVLRQSAMPDAVRYSVGAVTFVAWVVYFIFCGREQRRPGEARRWKEL